MITKKDIIKMARHVTRRGQGIPDRKLIHAERDWGIGLLIFSVIAIAGVVYNAHLFESVNNIEDDVLKQDSGIAVYKTDLVESALRDFGERKLQFQQIQGSRFVAPTIPDTDAAPASSSTTSETDTATEQKATERIETEEVVPDTAGEDGDSTDTGPTAG